MARRLSASSKKENAVDKAPIYRFERLDSSQPARVGDSIPLKIEGFSGSSDSIEISTNDPEHALKKEGWLLKPSRVPGAQFILVPLKSGKRTVPEVVAKQKGDDGKPGDTVFIVEPFSIDVESELKEGASPPPEALAPMGLPFPWVNAIFWFLGFAIVVAFLTALLMKYFRKSKKLITLPPLPPAPTSAEDAEALQRLSQLEADAWLQKGDFKKHYFGISEILKAYFGRRYGFDALECTTLELLRQLEFYALSADLLRQIRSFYEKLDRVKFTDFKPDASEGVELLHVAREFVHLTRKKIEEKLGEGPRAF